MKISEPKFERGSKVVYKPYGSMSPKHFGVGEVASIHPPTNDRGQYLYRLTVASGHNNLYWEDELEPYDEES